MIYADNSARKAEIWVKHLWPRRFWPICWINRRNTKTSACIDVLLSFVEIESCSFQDWQVFSQAVPHLLHSIQSHLLDYPRIFLSAPFLRRLTMSLKQWQFKLFKAGYQVEAFFLSDNCRQMICWPSLGRTMNNPFPTPILIILHLTMQSNNLSEAISAKPMWDWSLTDRERENCFLLFSKCWLWFCFWEFCLLFTFALILTQAFYCSRIDKFFLKVFPTLFIIFNIIYWLAFLL